jgi:phosphonate transport system substrate-binding protein
VRIPLFRPGRTRLLAGFLASHAGVLLLALCGLFVLQSAHAADKPLVLGVFPNMTAKQIVETYRPLADSLEKHLQRRVVIYSARDFKTFVERTHRGEYDIVLTAPHLAFLARREAGYRPLLKYAQPVRGILVVRHDAPLRDLGDLRGRTLATADPLALVVLAIHAELGEHGLRREHDYQTLDFSTHLNAAMQVINGRVDAAVMGLHPYNLMQPELRRQLRVLAETPPLSSLMVLTHPRLRDAEAQAIQKGLLRFAATPKGQAFIQRGGYGGFVEASGHELESFRPYALQAQIMLRAAGR